MFYEDPFDLPARKDPRGATVLCLTGATGFVGRQICRAVLEHGVALRVIVRDASKLDNAVVQAGVEVVESADVFHDSHANLMGWFQDVDTLIHCAWYAEPGQYLTSPINLDCLQGTLALARAFKDAGGRRFVGVGTCAEYDLTHGVLKTSTPLKPTTLYAASKAAAFHLMGQLLPPDKVEFLWCRLFYLYGEREDPRRLVPYLRQQFAAGEPAQLTSGRQIRDFIDVRDAGEMIAKAALGHYQGAINICSGIPVTVRQLAEQIADEYDARHLLHFGSRPDNRFDPPCVVGDPPDFEAL